MKLSRAVVAFVCLALCVIGNAFCSARAQTTTITVNIDANANRHLINPLIYGLAFASSPILSDLNCPLNRSGGNAATRYNRQLNASNRGNDWKWFPDAEKRHQYPWARDHRQRSQRHAHTRAAPVN